MIALAKGHIAGLAPVGRPGHGRLHGVERERADAVISALPSVIVAEPVLGYMRHSRGKRIILESPDILQAPFTVLELQGAEYHSSVPTLPLRSHDHAAKRLSVRTSDAHSRKARRVVPLHYARMVVTRLGLAVREPYLISVKAYRSEQLGGVPLHDIRKALAHPALVRRPRHKRAGLASCRHRTFPLLTRPITQRYHLKARPALYPRKVPRRSGAPQVLRARERRYVGIACGAVVRAHLTLTENITDPVGTRYHKTLYRSATVPRQVYQHSVPRQLHRRPLRDDKRSAKSAHAIRVPVQSAVDLMTAHGGKIVQCRGVTHPALQIGKKAAAWHRMRYVQRRKLIGHVAHRSRYAPSRLQSPTKTRNSRHLVELDARPARIPQANRHAKLVPGKSVDGNADLRGTRAICYVGRKVS